MNGQPNGQPSIDAMNFSNNIFHLSGICGSKNNSKKTQNIFHERQQEPAKTKKKRKTEEEKKDSHKPTFINHSNHPVVTFYTGLKSINQFNAHTCQKRWGILCGKNNLKNKKKAQRQIYFMAKILFL